MVLAQSVPFLCYNSVIKNCDTTSALQVPGLFIYMIFLLNSYFMAAS